MRILKSSLIKKILGVVLIMGCTGVFFNGYVGVSEPAHAQTTGDQVQEIGGDTSNTSLSTMGLWQILDMVLKIIYLLLRPLLVVAGLALDNTLVYASVFHLDAPLWKFRNMMKNFANFTLGFMVLFAIIKSILTNSGEGSLKDEKSPLGIIKVTLIAGILIQASRFLLAALVDVSTVATYAVGGLPLSVLKNTDIGNKKILSVNSSIDLNKFDVLSTKGENFKVRYSTSYKSGSTTKKVEFSPCRIEEGYIVGRQYTEKKFRNSDIFGSGQSACVAFGNQIVIYNEFPNVIGYNGVECNGITYKEELDRILKVQPFSEYWGPREACGYIIKIGGPTPNLGACGAGTGLSSIHDDWFQANQTAADDLKRITDYRPKNPPSTTLGLSGGTTWFASDNVLAMTTSDLIKKSRGFVGPLVTMYSSLLNFAQLTDSNVTTLGETSGVFLIKTGVAIALFFPLIALALVLIARIGILRLYIVASPFIVIKACFSKFIEMKSLDKYLNIKSVMGIVFAPVITVAALSLSLIFMTALVNGFQSTSNRAEINQTFGTQQIEPIKPGNDAISFNGVAQIEFTKLPWGEAMDRFSRLMVNFFAIGLMRMIFFAALKANALGEKIGGEVQNFGSNVFKTLPILPLGEGGKGVGIGSALKEVGKLPDTYISNITSAQGEQVREWLGQGPEKNILNETQIKETLETIRTAEPGTAETKVTEYLKTQNITATTTEIGTTHATAIYAVMKNMPLVDQKSILTNLPTMNDDYKTLAKADVDTNIPLIASTTQANIDTFVQDRDIKLSLDRYFNTGATAYENTVGTKKVTITKNPDGNYIGVLADVPAAP